MNIKGLTNTEVEERKQKGLINYVDEPKTKTIKEIIIKEANIDLSLVENIKF